MFESFKDFIESVGDDELFELYDEFLKTGDDSRMMLHSYYQKIHLQLMQQGLV